MGFLQARVVDLLDLRKGDLTAQVVDFTRAALAGGDFFIRLSVFRRGLCFESGLIVDRWIDRKVRHE